MTDTVEQFQNTLKQARLSVTKPRQVVFKAFQNHEPQTMQELVQVCGQNIDRASIYRTVGLFETLGIIQRLQIGWKYKLELSDRFTHHHHHISCMRCGKTLALPEDETVEQRIVVLAQAKDFLPIDHQLEVRGLCRACQLDPSSGD